MFPVDEQLAQVPQPEAPLAGAFEELPGSPYSILRWQRRHFREIAGDILARMVLVRSASATGSRSAGDEQRQQDCQESSSTPAPHTLHSHIINKGHYARVHSRAIH